MQALCDWARNNVPLLTARSDEEIERVVCAARDEKNSLVIALGIAVAVASALLTYRVTDFFGPSTEGWQIVLAAVVAGFAFTIIGRFIYDLIMHREISRLARGTDGLLSHE